MECQTLIINSSLIVEEQLVQLLQRLPALRHLELADCEDVSPFLLNVSSFYPYLFSLFVRPTTRIQELSNSEEWLCPNLQRLSIDGCTSIDSQAVRTFIGSRMPNCQSPMRPNKPCALPIQELHIARCLLISPDTVQWLRTHVSRVCREV